VRFDSLRQHAPAPLLLLVCLLLVLLPHLAHVPIWLSLTSIGLILWRAAHQLLAVRLPGRFLRLLLLFTLTGGLLWQYQTILGREAGTALLLLLLSLKLMELNSRRDVFVIIYLSYFMTILGFLFSQSIPVALYMILLVLALVTTQILYAHPTNAANAWARLPHHARLAARMLVQALPIAALLFVLFPRIPGPIWGLPADAFSASSGLSDQMSPGRISRLSNDDSVAFRVKFEHQVPPPASLYWRGPVLWSFDGNTWRAPNDNNARENQTLFDIFGSSAAVGYAVTLQPHQKHWLFVLDTPVTIPVSSRLTPERQLLSLEPVRKLLRYEARSYLQYRVDQNIDWRRDMRFLSLPAHSAPRTRALMHKLRQSHPADPDLVDATLDYFRHQPFYYSRKAPLLFDHPVDEFIFDTRKGFCEHFASSFTVMMRLAGIPARVVTGYQGGEMNPLSDYMIVRQSDAHAWSEVWLEGIGWKRVDPTSVIPPSRIESDDDIVRRQPNTDATRKLLQISWLNRRLRQSRYAWDAMNNRWNQWVVGFNQQRQASLFEALGVPQIKWQGLATIMGVSVSLVILLLAWHLYRKPAAPPDAVQASYRIFLQRLAGSGFPKNTNETPGQFARRVGDAREDLAAVVTTITRLYQKLHYGAVISPTLVLRLQTNVRRFRPRNHKQN